MDGPRTIVLHRQNGAFGFTLRHFIVYPPDVQDPVVAKKLAACGLANFSQPMDTVFVKKVIPQSEADSSGLKEGDRLIAVNGQPVSLQFQFADIVATIQKTPKTLHIQIVPKCYDILQTFFSETAHNPETNQRPQQQQQQAPQLPARSSLMPIMSLKQQATSSLQSPSTSQQQFPMQSVTGEKQEALLYMPVTNRSVYAGNCPMAIVQPRILQNSPQQQQQLQLYTSPINNEVKDAILSRLRHQIEQKEEFLKRPNKPLLLEPSPQQQQQQHNNNNHEQMQFQRASSNFFQPNRLKADWLPVDHGRSLESMRHQQQQSNSQEISDMQSNRFTLREQFFNKERSDASNAFFSLPTSPYSPYYAQESHHQQSNGSFIGSNSSMTEGSLSLKSDDNRHHLRVIGSSPIPSQGLHIVSERTKQFESGRPLSPDGIDRTALYKSELSRINTKQVASNVALRRQVFESKPNIDSSWRCSSDDKIKIDTKDIRSLPIKARSLSVESVKDREKSVEANVTIITTNNASSKKERPKPVRENSYLTAVRASPDSVPVILRQKVSQRSASEEEDRKTRRTSYLKATANEEFQFSSDVDQNSISITPEDDETQSQLKVSYNKWAPPFNFGVDIQFLRRMFEEPQQASLTLSNDIASTTTVAAIAAAPNNENLSIHATSHASTKAKALAYFRDNAITDVNVPITKQGILHVKVTIINGRRSNDRNWRQCNAELKKNIIKLTILREGKATQSPDSSSGTIDLSNFDVTDGNYTKRKNVFRLSSAHYPACDNECELLLQAQNSQDMSEWMSCLRSVSKSNEADCTNVQKQKAEPQRIAALETMQASTLSSDDNPSPLPSKTTHRKYHFGSRSPSGQSPVTKSRKAPQNLLVSPSPLTAISGKESSDKEISSPKQKSWKHFVANQFKKMQPQTDSPTSNDASEGCILSQCTPSEENFYVPLLVAKCTKIVETRGLNIVGIYRIPGNTAAITNLNELINRNGMDDEQTLNDPKWEDVNVVSSLLKLFIRSLPEPILPNELYGNFIEADKKSDHNQRFQELRCLLMKLPQHNYETLKHLIAHLNTVSDNAIVNLMEPRNLAIVFGPSIIRRSNDSLEMVVKDMRHQCQIVESLISHYGYFFENDPLPKPKNYQPSTDSGSELPSADFLLENVAKIEQFTALFNKDAQKEGSSRFVANIVQAANRKIRKSAQRRSTSSSMTPDSLSLESMTTSAESKDLQKKANNPKTAKLRSSESLAETPRSSEDDFDSAFIENGENGSSSLTATVTALLDNKLRSLRNSSIESSNDESKIGPETTTTTSLSSSNNSNPRFSVISKMTHLQHPSIGRPLTLGENIPFADESPERPLIQARVKPIRQSLTNNSSNSSSNSSNISEKLQQTPQKPTEVHLEMIVGGQSQKENKNNSKLSLTSDDTDSSTTSNYRERMRSVIRLEDSVLRKVNRILTNLEHLERKYSLNRSLSLNYKSHRSNNNNNNECCCNNASSAKVGGIVDKSSTRLSLTKDEKTDKNINRRRQLHDTTNSGGNLQSSGGGGGSKYRRNGSRSIRRRHTVGGTQDVVLFNPAIMKTPIT